MDRDTAEPDATALPGPNAEKWAEFHHEHAMPSEYSHEFVWDVTAGADGSSVTDVDGNVLLGFTCHIGAAPLGYNNEKVLSKLREFDLVESMEIAGQDMYFEAGPDPEMAEFLGASHLMDKLTDAPSHYGMNMVFLSNSGTEAVENTMKITHDHEAPAKYGYVFEGGFHGRTLGTPSLTKSKEIYTRHYPQVAGIETVPFCVDSGCSGDDDAYDCGFSVDDGPRLWNSLSPEGGHVNPDEVVLAILEPIQDVGGHRFLSEASMAEVGDICDTYDIPSVVDEIQSGVGRIGEMWATDRYPIEPGVIASAKGLCVGAIVSRANVFPIEKNRLGSTFGGGDLFASMQDALILDAIGEYDLFDDMTKHDWQTRELLVDGAPDCVVDVRGKGLMLAVELGTRKRRGAVAEVALDRGLLTLGCGKKTIRLLPPLNSIERETELGVGIFREAMDAVAAEVVM